MNNLATTRHKDNHNDHGFVLVTALIMLSLLTLMSLAMFYSSRSATLVSSGAQRSTEAYYYAETAVNYIAWAWANDAEFDSYTYAGTYTATPFTEPPTPPTTNPTSIGDSKELESYPWYPGPTVISDSLAAGTSGQVMYFDNSPMSKRAICFQDANILNKKFKNCIDVSIPEKSRIAPPMHQISSRLPRYIKLDIGKDGTITPSIPQLPHHANPAVGQDIPKNGAIVWLTAADPDPNNPDHDIEIFALDPAHAYGGVPVSPNKIKNICVGSTIAGDCPCDSSKKVTGNDFSTAQACDASNKVWLPALLPAGLPYNIVAYAIGYVNGKPSHMLRAIIK